MPFWDETARLGPPTANLVIVFETFTQFKGVVPLRSAAREKLFKLVTGSIHSVVALWS